jgi:two-component system response regulator YesN
MVFAPYAEEEKLAQRVRPDVPVSLKCELHALILAVLAEATRNLDVHGAIERTGTIERLKPALEFMDAHFIENPPLAEIAGKTFMAPNYFHKVFKEAFDTTPFDYMRDKRLNMAKEALAFSNLSVKEIAAKTGYGDAFHFSKDFKKRVGVPPKTFRKRSRSERAIENYPE